MSSAWEPAKTGGKTTRKSQMSATSRLVRRAVVPQRPFSGGVIGAIHPHEGEGQIRQNTERPETRDRLL
jgi:hypothetical protein